MATQTALSDAHSAASSAQAETRAVGSHTLDKATLEAASKLPVWSEDGKSTPFGDLFKEQKTIVVLIRHFLCGLCQAYVEELGKVPKAALDEAGTCIVVVGCGEWTPIKKYKEDTANFPYEIYSDPTRELYRTLGLMSKLSGPLPDEPKRSYLPNNIALSTMKSIWRGVGQITSVTKMGNISQNGGDFVLGPGITSSFVWRMQNSQDHIDVAELMAAAGVAWPVQDTSA